jgi:hypothetical protein
MHAFRALQLRETIRADRAEPYADLEPWRAAILLWPASAASVSVVGNAAAKLRRLDELDGVAIRVFEPR